MIKKLMLNSNNIFLIFVVRIVRFIKIKSLSLFQSVEALLRKNGIGSKRFLWIKNYQNKYKGKRCFIIATGPSLTVEDLEKLKNEYTFGMNSLCLAGDRTDFVPTFFGVQDPGVYEKVADTLENYDCGCIIVSDLVVRKYKKAERYNCFPSINMYHVYESMYEGKYFAKFSDDCYAAVYDGYSVTYSLIQIAVYMGFDEIYLIGADCNYEQGKPQHFIEHGHIDPKANLAKDKMFASYREAKKYADEHNIHIYNATRGGKLEIFERVNFDDLNV